MPVSYTNRKGLTYTLYRGQTKTGKPRYYFGRAGQSQGEPVTELPPGYTISESVNGVVSLVKDRPSLIQPEEVAAVEAVVQQHPDARRYRVAVKRDRIEIYDSTNTTRTNLTAAGNPLNLSADYVSANSTYAATMQRVGNNVVITFGALTSGAAKTGAKKGKMTWTPSASATDLAGNPVASTTITEAGGKDTEF